MNIRSMAIRKTPLGFGSSTTRFSVKRTISSPGPGTYFPNYQATQPRIQSTTFSRAKRCLGILRKSDDRLDSTPHLFLSKSTVTCSFTFAPQTKKVVV